MDVGSFIHKKRIEKGLTLEELGDKVGVGKSTVRKWEVGMIKDIRRDKIALLSQALDVSPLAILGIEEDEELYTNVGLDYIKVPLYSPICCGDGGFNDDNILDYIPVPSLKLSPRKEYFCQYAKGDSMKGAGIDNGDLLVFEKSSTIDNGLIGCFCVDENEAMCKKYTLVGGNIILMPMNSDYEPIAVSIEAFKCIGVLKKVIKDF